MKYTSRFVVSLYFSNVKYKSRPKTHPMKHHLVIMLISCLSLTACSDPGSEYVDIWVMRGTPNRITISQKGDSFQIVASPIFQGVYVLDDQGRLVNGMPNTRFEYDDENDVIVWGGNDPWPTSEIFERLATHNEKMEGLDSDIAVVVNSTVPEVIDTNKLTGHWSTTYAYYASTVTANLDIIKQPNDSCEEYLCIWTTSGGSADHDRKTWCAKATSGMLAADTKMGGRATHMYAVKKDDRTLSVTFSYNSDEILPWRLEFTKQ